MSRLLQFDYDGSLWRFDRNETELLWTQVHSKVVEKYSESNGWTYRVTRRGDRTYHEHIHTIVQLGERILEIDAVLGKQSGPGRITARTIAHLDGEMVGHTRATGGAYGSGHSGFTYVEFKDILIGLSPPATTDFVSRMGLPTIEIWCRTTEEKEGRIPEPDEIEYKRIPGKDGTWQEQMMNRSSWNFGDHVVVSDGTLRAGPWYGNPRDIRLLSLAEEKQDVDESKPSEGSGKVCQKCQTENSNADKFCVICGNKLGLKTLFNESPKLSTAKTEFIFTSRYRRRSLTPLPDPNGKPCLKRDDTGQEICWCGHLRSHHQGGGCSYCRSEGKYGPHWYGESHLPKDKK